MAEKNIITKIEGNKVWGYVAMGAGVLAAVAIAIVVKEELDARKAADNLAIAEAELDAVAAGAEASAEVVEGGEEIGVGELEGDAPEQNFSGFRGGFREGFRRRGNRGFVSSYRPLREANTFGEGGGLQYANSKDKCLTSGGIWRPLSGHPRGGKCGTAILSSNASGARGYALPTSVKTGWKAYM